MHFVVQECSMRLKRFHSCICTLVHVSLETVAAVAYMIIAIQYNLYTSWLLNHFLFQPLSTYNKYLPDNTFNIYVQQLSTATTRCSFFIYPLYFPTATVDYQLEGDTDRHVNRVVGWRSRVGTDSLQHAAWKHIFCRLLLLLQKCFVEHTICCLSGNVPLRHFAIKSQIY